MKPFPEDHELVSLFESKPEILDSDVAWYYNQLTFRGERDGVEFMVRISPSNEVLEIQLSRSKETIAHLVVSEVCGLRIKENKTEALAIASFAKDSNRGILKLRIRPTPSIEWPFELH